jgi:hypothetical protein
LTSVPAEQVALESMGNHLARLGKRTVHGKIKPLAYSESACFLVLKKYFKFLVCKKISR